MNFQVLSIPLQILKKEVFQFANSSYVWNKKKKNESKRKHRVPEFSHKQEDKIPFNNLTRNKTSR